MRSLRCCCSLNQQQSPCGVYLVRSALHSVWRSLTRKGRMELIRSMVPRSAEIRFAPRQGRCDHGRIAWRSRRPGGRARCNAGNFSECQLTVYAFPLTDRRRAVPQCGSRSRDRCQWCPVSSGQHHEGSYGDHTIRIQVRSGRLSSDRRARAVRGVPAFVAPAQSPCGGAAPSG